MCKLGIVIIILNVLYILCIIEVHSDSMLIVVIEVSNWFVVF